MHERHPHLIWSIVKNALSQTGGKALLSVIRFGIAALIVRLTGVERFGEYSLTMMLLLVTDWVADFALTDVAIRTACQDGSREPSVLRALAAAKVVQVVIAFVFLLTTLLVMGYPPQVFRAGLIGGAGVLFYGGMLVYRAYFKIGLTMERDAAVEVVGALASAPILWYACVHDAPLEALVGCYTFSRVASLATAAALGRRMPALLRHGAATLPRAMELGRAAAPLGVAGLLVAVYNALDLVMLSKLQDARAVGLFSAAQRFVFLVLIVIDAVGAALFPVMASLWNRRDADFRMTLQRGVEVAIVLATGAFCVFQTNAEFLLGLLGPESVAAAPVLRILALALTLRATTFILAPVLLVTGRQRYALWITAAGLASKAALLTWLIPKYGALGAAYSWLATDLLIGLIPAVILVQRIVGFRLGLSRIPRIALAAGACIGLTMVSGLDETFFGVVLVGVSYPALILLTRAVTITDMRSLAAGVGQRFGSRGPS